MTLNEAKLKVWPKIIERSKFPVKAAILLEGERDVCQYRVDANPDNTAPENCCFIGVCITPKEYSVAKKRGAVEISIRHDNPFAAFLRSNGIRLSKDNRDHFRLWCSLVQNVHDSQDPKDWDQLLERYAPR